MMRKLFSAIAIIIVPFFLFGQVSQEGAVITGRVTDAGTGDPLIGVNVFIEDTPIGAATDADGNFQITYSPTADFILVFSYIAYKPVRLELSPTDVLTGLSVALEQDVFRGEEVVVTGLASARAKSVAEVSVSRIDVGTLTEANTYKDLSQLMYGKISGVDLKHASGNVGGGFRMDVRSGGGLNGNEQPIIYVDGVRADNAELSFYGVGGQGVSTLADLNPEDIEDIEVLKGPAAAASYGTSGSNGVVLITTKKGRVVPGVGKPFRIDYKYVTGKNQQSYEYTADDINTWEAGNGIFGDGDIEQHSVSIRGGTPASRYYVSFDDRYEEGIMKYKDDNWMDRKSVRVNLDAFPSKALTLSVSASYSDNTVSTPDNDNNTWGWLGNTVLAGGPYTPYIFLDSLAVLNLRHITATKRFMGSVQASFRPFADNPTLKGLELNASVGLDDSNLRQDRTYHPDYWYSGNLSSGGRYATVRQNQLLSTNLGASFSLDLGSIKSTTTVTNQNFERRYGRVELGKVKFPSALVSSIGTGTDYDQADEYFEHRRESGILFNEELSFFDQYFLTIDYRRDYASIFASEAPASITYPGARFAWRVDRLGVLPSFVNMLKVRAAYGETGVLPGVTDGIALLWGPENSGYGTGAILDNIGNDEIEPERIKETEFGIDAELFGKFSLEFTFYMQSAENSITDLRNAPSTGLTASALPYNVGSMEGSGWEALLQFTPFSSANSRLDLVASASFQENEVTDIGEAQPIYDGFDVNVIKPGLPKHAFYVAKVVGAVFDEEGYYDGVELDSTNEEDLRVFMGVPSPKMFGHLSANLRLFKNFTFYALIDGKFGHKVFNSTGIFQALYYNDPNRDRLRQILGMAYPWAPDTLGLEAEVGSQEYIDAAHEYARSNPNYDGNFIEDADFVKLREVSVGYSFRDFLPLLGLEKQVSDISLYYSLNNWKTWTDYSGPDPEVGFTGALDDERGQDFLTLQSPKTWYMTLRVSF